jgi:hypothetical protein
MNFLDTWIPGTGILMKLICLLLQNNDWLDYKTRYNSETSIKLFFILLNKISQNKISEQSVKLDQKRCRIRILIMRKEILIEFSAIFCLVIKCILLNKGNFFAWKQFHTINQRMNIRWLNLICWILFDSFIWMFRTRTKISCFVFTSAMTMNVMLFDWDQEHSGTRDSEWVKFEHVKKKSKK